MAPDPGPATREAAVEHVLREVYPGRLEAEVAGTATDERGPLVGVKVHPRGYLSTAKYALVVLDGEGAVLAAERCSGRDLRRELGPDEE